jgi:hypothetical protein
MPDGPGHDDETTIVGATRVFRTALVDRRRYGPGPHEVAVGVVYILTLRAPWSRPQPLLMRAAIFTTIARPSTSRAAGQCCQFGRAAAPMTPHRVHTMRGPHVGTGTALKIALWRHTPARQVERPHAVGAPAVSCIRGQGRSR